MNKSGDKEKLFLIVAFQLIRSVDENSKSPLANTTGIIDISKNH